MAVINTEDDMERFLGSYDDEYEDDYGPEMLGDESEFDQYNDVELLGFLKRLRKRLRKGRKRVKKFFKKRKAARIAAGGLAFRAARFIPGARLALGVRALRKRLSKRKRRRLLKGAGIAASFAPIPGARIARLALGIRALRKRRRKRRAASRGGSIVSESPQSRNIEYQPEEPMRAMPRRPTRGFRRPSETILPAQDDVMEEEMIEETPAQPEKKGINPLLLAAGAAALALPLILGKK